MFSLSPQHTWNHLRHHSNNWGQWAKSTSPNHTLLPHGLAPRPIPNSTSPGRRCPLNAQQLCCTQGKHNERRHHHRALQRALGPLQVCLTVSLRQAAAGTKGGEQREKGGGEGLTGGKQMEVAWYCKWWGHLREEQPDGCDHKRVGGLMLNMLASIDSTTKWLRLWLKFPL